MYFSVSKKDFYIIKIAVCVPHYGRRCRTRTAIPAPKAGVLPLHYILYMVEPRGIEPLSKIPT